MATAVSPMENGRSSRAAAAAAATAAAPPSRSISNNPRLPSRPLLQPRSASATSSSSGSPPFATSSSTRSGSGSGGAGGTLGSVLASIMSMGASAFPASLIPFSVNDGGGSLPPGTPRGRRHGTAGGGGGGRGRGGVGAGAGAGVVPATNASSLSPSSSSSLSRGVLPALGVDRAAAAAAVAVAPAAAGVGVVEERDRVERENASLETAAGGVGTVEVSRLGGRKSATQKVYLEGGSAVYTCASCRAHLATRDHVVSECFHGHGGRAFLFERCVNVTAGRPEGRRLMTGMHVVADITCNGCGTELGWKYEEAADEREKYKEGKFILERCAVTLEGCDGDGFFGSDRYGSDRYGSDRYGSGRYESFSGRFGSSDNSSRSCGSGSIIGWGSDNALFADGARW